MAESANLAVKSVVSTVDSTADPEKIGVWLQALSVYRASGNVECLGLALRMGSGTIYHITP